VVALMEGDFVKGPDHPATAQTPSPFGSCFIGDVTARFVLAARHDTSS
jgi:hypothetical protein